MKTIIVVLMLMGGNAMACAKVEPGQPTPKCAPAPAPASSSTQGN